MTSKDIIRLLADYPNYTRRIIKLNHEIHDLMKAMHENCQQMAIQSTILNGLPKSGKVSDPVYNAYLETEKLTCQYQDKIKDIANEILRIIDNKSMIDNALNLLKAYERSIVELRYIRRLSWNKIATMTVYSDRQCRTIKDKAMHTIMSNMQ